MLISEDFLDVCFTFVLSIGRKIAGVMIWRFVVTLCCWLGLPGVLSSSGDLQKALVKI